MAKIVEVTNPVTGQPTQVDQLDHTAQQIDDAVGRALPGGYYDKWVSQLPGQNLLDNSVFIDGCLVDQRQGYVVPPGSTWYTEAELTNVGGTISGYEIIAEKTSTYAKSAGGGYFAASDCIRGYTGAGMTIDRWDLYGGTNPTMLIENGHIRLTGSGFFRQIIPVSQIPRGTLVTFSILMASGELYSLTTTVPDIGVDSSQVFFPGGFLRIFGWNADTDVYSIWFDGEVSPVAAKLELSSQQTLAHKDSSGAWHLNELPNYADTLARCQRYQFGINPTRYGRPAIGVSTSQSSGAFVLSLPVTMREIPTVTFRDLQVFYLGNNYNVTSINVSGLTDNAVLMDITFDAAIPNGVALILVANEGSELLLNANL